jgi:fatty acid desaturase
MATPRLRDRKEGYKTIYAFGYALFADFLGMLLMIQPSGGRDRTLVAMALAIHGRVVAAYLVHEATHDTIFVETWANRCMGIACTWLAGCPYCNFDHIRKMHIAHHKDRTDLVEFDYRSFVQNGHPLVKAFCCFCEYCFIPIVETSMNLRQALGPILIGIFLPRYNRFFSRERIWSASLGSSFQVAFYLFLWHHNALFIHLICGAVVLQVLAFGDAFHHTYEAVFPQDYVPGPGNRTAQFEEDNTYSNLISTSYPRMNLLNLNFGYHNAHHKRPMVPWYQLPSYHEKLYKSGQKTVKDWDALSACPQVLPVNEVYRSWYRHRIRRITEDHYGRVHPAGTPDRARDFVGTLGASFLTV